jgi:hypothetical protein
MFPLERLGSGVRLNVPEQRTMAQVCRMRGSFTSPRWEEVECGESDSAETYPDRTGIPHLDLTI